MLLTWGQGGGGNALTQGLSFALGNLTTTVAPTTSAGSSTPTFTRATIATVFDWENILKTVLSGEVRFQGARRVQNLLTNTENFANAIWTLNQSGTGSLPSKTPNFGVAPDGTTTACRVQWNRGGGTTAGDFSIIDQAISATVGGVVVGSIWLKSNSGSNVNTWFRGGASVVAPLSAVVVTPTWQRFSVTNTGSATGHFSLGSIQNLGDTVGDILVWHPQVEDVTGQSNQNAAEYVSSGVLSSPFQGAMVDGVQYFAWQNGNTVSGNVVTQAQGAAISSAILKAYEVENARTNLCLQSRDFSNASWTKTNATGARDQVGIDGIANSASSMTATAINGSCLQTITEAATQSALSMYIKRITGTGTVVIQQGATTLDVTASINSSTYTRVELDASVLNPSIGIVLGTNGDKIAVDYVQFENGGFASSPIATTTASVTRNGDLLTFPAAGNFSNGTNFGTLYLEFAMPSLPVSASTATLFAENVGGNNRLEPRVYTTTPGTEVAYGTGAAANTVAGAAVVINTIYKLVVTYGANGVKIYQNGVLTNSNATASNIGPSTTFALGSLTSGGAQLFGTIRNFRLWSKVLTDAQIAGL